MSKLIRLIAALLALLMLISLAACSSGKDSSDSTESEPASSASSKVGGFGSTSRPSRPESSAPELTVADFFKNEVIAYNQKAGVAKTGIMDFSWMNDAPAGKHGWVQVQDGDFVFEDGTPVKFWGVNLGFGVCAPQKDVAEAIAEELYRLGVNMVRIHANTFGGGILDYSENTTQKFDEAFFDRMDYLIYLLKQRGIYIHLDLLTAKEYLEGDGFTAVEVNYFKQSGGGNGIAKEVRFFDERCIRLDKELITNILNHFNPYTEMKYCEDPVFAVMQYSNESCISWQQAGIKNPFADELNDMYNQWLLEKYGNRTELAKAWTNDEGECALSAEEDPANGTVVHPAIGVWSEPTTNWLNNYVGHSSPVRHAEWMQFLYETEANAINGVYTLIRELGVKCPINVSNYVMGPVDRKVNSLGDVMEKNAYWGDNDTAMVECNPKNAYPRNTLIDVMCASVTDKPLIITEWNCHSTVEFKADGIFQTAAYGALQGWDGFTLFTWTFQSGSSYFYTTAQCDLYTSNIDPSTIGQFSICGAMFRLGIVSEAENEIECAYTDADVFEQISDIMSLSVPVSFVSKFSYNFIGDKYTGDADMVITSGNTASGDYTAAKNLLLHCHNPYTDAYQKINARETWLATYIENGAQTEEIGGADFVVGKNSIVCTEPCGSSLFNGGNVVDIIGTAMRKFELLDEDEGWLDGKVVSDTKEITLDYTKKAFTVDTDRVDVYAGITGGSAAAGSFLVTTKNDKAAVSIMAVKEDKIETANSLFIYAMGRCANNFRNLTGGDGSTTGIGYTPIIYEDIRGTLSLTSEKASAKVWGLDYTGSRKNEINVTKTATGFDIEIGGYCYYEVELAD